MELWEATFPKRTVDGPVSSRWKELGFQGEVEFGVRVKGFQGEVWTHVTRDPALLSPEL